MEPDLAAEAGTPVRARGLGAALRTTVEVLAFGVIPAVIALTFLVDSYHSPNFAVDLEQTLLPAARTIADGHSPYPGYGYPPLVAFALVPLTLLPGPDLVFAAILAACAPLSLWLFGVRDWRCYGIVFAWAPVLAAIQTGNVTLLLLLGSAVCWRYRERYLIASAGGGLAFAAKILCWPLALWLAATRRYRAAIGVVLVSGVVTFVLWGALGFSGLVNYPSSLQKLDTAVSSGSYTLKVLLLEVGAPAPLPQALGTLLALAVLAAIVVLGRRGDDPRSFALCCAAMLVASPIVWMHSFTLLLGAVAVTRPRLSIAWFVPLLFVVGSGTGNGSTWQTAGVLLVGAVTVVLAVLPQRSARPVADAAATA